MEGAFREQERRYNDVVRERAALMEEHQRARALRTANEARSSVSLSDSSRDLERARQAIRQSSYEAQAVGELGTSETERQIAAAEVDIKRLDAERELEMMELQMGLRDAESLEAAPPNRNRPTPSRRPRRLPKGRPRKRRDPMARRRSNSPLLMRLAPFGAFTGFGTLAFVGDAYSLAAILGIGAFVTGGRLLTGRGTGARNCGGRRTRTSASSAGWRARTASPPRR